MALVVFAARRPCMVSSKPPHNPNNPLPTAHNPQPKLWIVGVLVIPLWILVKPHNPYLIKKFSDQIRVVTEHNLPKYTKLWVVFFLVISI